jgi:Ca2+-binding RTX toxin-like protein
MRRLALAIGGVLIWASMVTAFAATNTVPPTKLHDSTTAITPEDLAPADCATYQTLTSVVAASGNYTGTAASQLILGSNSGQTIDGGGGDDCILGGGGNDTLRGAAGVDLIYGGPGNDSIDGGADTDACWGEAGTDTFANCEYPFQ